MCDVAETHVHEVVTNFGVRKEPVASSSFRAFVLMSARATALTFIVGACHEYRPVLVADLTPSTMIRVRYDPPRDLVVRHDTTGAALRQVSQITGRVVARRGDSLEVRVGSLLRAGTAPSGAAPETIVAVPLDTATVRARRVAPGRTALTILGVLGTAVVALFVACGDFCR